VVKVKEVQETVEEESAGLLSKLPIPSIPLLPWRELYKELVVPVLQPTVGSVVNNATKVVSVANKAAAVGPDVVLQGIQDTAASVAAARATQAGQTGGGLGSSSSSSSGLGGPGPVIAGSLTALILAGGLKGFYDFLAKQTN
jgi:hypothetical protein